MNKYVIPYSDGEDVFINSVTARNFEDAKNKLIKVFVEEFDLDVIVDWRDLCNTLDGYDVVLGSIYDIEEL